MAGLMSNNLQISSLASLEMLEKIGYVMSNSPRVILLINFGTFSSSNGW